MTELTNPELRSGPEREVPPDPSLARYIGAHHSLQSAVADLVDNSISAGATKVLVRFVQRSGRAAGLRIIDDGAGMSSAELDDAMVMGRGRDYGSAELGHFGVGLKAASLSQADVLSVVSRRDGSTPVGRVLRNPDGSGSPRVSDLHTEAAAGALDGTGASLASDHGTVVEWHGVRTFPQDPDADAQASWLDATIRNIRTGLGARHHRIIADGGPRIAVDVFDEDANEAGAEFEVLPLDPFAYTPDADSGYPKRFHGELDGQRFSFTAHVIPYEDRTSPNYLLSLSGEDQRQGFFVYRRNRLLQIGGWNGVTPASEELRFARVSLDIDEIEGHAAINPEKSGVEFDASLRSAILVATADDGTQFRGFKDAAGREDTLARSRQRRPLDFTPATGIPVDVGHRLQERGHLNEDVEPYEIRWGWTGDGNFFEADVEGRVLTINSRFHELLTNRRIADGRSGPLTRTLVYLLTADLFSGQYLGAAQKLRMDAMQEALWLAALDEEKSRAKRGRRTP
ncbi:MAG: ATP-binding protein [Galactobacter sp.]